MRDHAAMLFSEGLYAELPLALRGDPSAVIGRAYDRAVQSMLSTEEYVIGDPEEDDDDGDGYDAAAAGHENNVASSDKSVKGGIPLLSTRRSGLLSNFYHVGQFWPARLTHRLRVLACRKQNCRRGHGQTRS